MHENAGARVRSSTAGGVHPLTMHTSHDPEGAREGERVIEGVAEKRPAKGSEQELAANGMQRGEIKQRSTRHEP